VSNDQGSRAFQADSFEIALPGCVYQPRLSLGVAQGALELVRRPGRRVESHRPADELQVDKNGLEPALPAFQHHGTAVFRKIPRRMTRRSHSVFH